MTQYVFVSLSHDWSDEFDVTGAFVSSRAEFNTNMKKIEEAFEEQVEGAEYYFGTNEALMFSDFMELTQGINAKTCTEEFHDEFLKMWPSGNIGFNIIDSIIETLTEEEEVDEEEDFDYEDGEDADE